VKVPDNWTFRDKDVAAGFDTHVREQLPWYDIATQAIATIGRHYIPEGGRVYDLGASTGNIGRALGETIEARRARLVSIEQSPQMAAKWIGPQPQNLIIDSIQNVTPRPYDLAVAFLVFMFLPPAEQIVEIERWRKAAKPTGALIVVERFLPPAGYMSIVTSRMTLAAKRDAGVPAEDIIDKELSLAGVQRPLSMRAVGMDATPFFRFGDFAGYVLTSGNGSEW
jgi:tRNA (cmo5U34)-methyltransferase